MTAIRAAVPADAEAATLAFRAARAGMTYLPRLHTAEEDRAFIASRLDTGRVLVATPGACSPRVLGLTWWSVDDGAGWLDGLYLEPPAQGSGIGSSLLAAVKQHLPGGFRLWVFQENTGARRFYERHGCTLERVTDGAGNEERVPDALYRWAPPAS